jgi:hypothetical protein
MNQETSPETPDRPTLPRNRVEELIRIATELTDEIEDLARSSGHQFVSLARTAKINRRLIWTSITAVAFALVLATVVAINAVSINNITDRLDTQQTVQRQRALCPLYGIFLDSKSAQGRKQAPDPAKYDHAFEVIAEGYAVLECDQYLKESGRDAW